MYGVCSKCCKVKLEKYLVFDTSGSIWPSFITERVGGESVMDVAVRLTSSYLLWNDQVSSSGLSSLQREATSTSRCAAVIIGLAQGQAVVMIDLLTFLTLNYPKNDPQLLLCNPERTAVFTYRLQMFSDVKVNVWNKIPKSTSNESWKLAWWFKRCRPSSRCWQMQRAGLVLHLHAFVFTLSPDGVLVLSQALLFGTPHLNVPCNDTVTVLK